MAALVPLAFTAFVVWPLTQDAGNLGPIPLLIILPGAAGYHIVLVLLRLVWRGGGARIGTLSSSRRQD